MKSLRVIVALAAIFVLSFFSIGKLQAVVEEKKEADIRRLGNQDAGYQVIRATGMPGEPGISKEAKEPQYAPAELIVKLKEGETLDGLQELNSKYKVTSTGKVFKETPNPEGTLKQLKDKLAKLNTEHESWYWQLDKDSQEYKDYQARIEKEKGELTTQIQAQEELLAHLEQRQKRAPEGAETPNLENIYLLKTEDQGTNISLMVADYKANPSVEYAEPNYIAKVQMVPNDPLYGQQWAHQKTEAEKGWGITTGSPGVIIAIVDTGVDYNHEDLKTNIWKDPQGNSGKDFVDINTNSYINAGFQLIAGEDYTGVDNAPSDYHGHGTHCAGIAGAVGNNGIGVAGVCHNCKIMPVRAGFAIDYEGNSYGLLEYDDIANAIAYAADMGADVISMSFEGAGSQTLKTAMDYAHSYPRNCVLIAAAGNENTNEKSYPAAYDNIIDVAATAQDDAKTRYSNYGYWVDVAAPGGDSTKDSMILSTVPKTGILSDLSGYRSLEGTSMACPYVAGLTGLLLSKYPDATNIEIRGRITGTTDTFSQDYAGTLGTGRVSLYKALNTANRKPYIWLREVSFQEYEGDKDQILESGEKVKLIIKLENLWKDASSVSAILSTTSEYIYSIPVSFSDFGCIVGGETKDNISSPFVFQLGNIKYEKIINFTLTTNADGVVQTLAFNIPPLGVQKIVKSTIVSPPFISDNKIVWEDYRNGVYALYLYDLETNQEKQIAIIWNPSSSEGYFCPQISSNKIVWQDERNGTNNYDIYLYDLETNQEKQITTNSTSQYNPSISGNKIVWSDWRNGNLDIYLYDLNTNQEKRITTNPSHQYFPSISGNKIVWIDKRNMTRDIYLYDLNTNQEKRITTNSTSQYTPFISGNKIVWSDGFNIHLYDLETNQEKQITVSLTGHDRSYPIISGNKIVWQDEYQDNITNKIISTHIYLYDLETNQESQITFSTDTHWYPSISGNKIIWVSNFREIYILTIPDNIPPTGTISINNGATYAKSTSATLNLSATDSESGLDKMQFYNDNATWSTPESYATSKSWTLTSGNGTKTVYVKFYDKAGNWKAFQDTIILDTTLPTIADPTLTTTNPQKVNQTLVFKAKVTDDLSGVKVVYLMKRVYGGVFVGYYYQYYPMIPQGSGLYQGTLPAQSSTGTITYKFRARDNAGNQTETGLFNLYVVQ